MAITALPVPPQRSDPANFPARADTFMTALPTFGVEANALQADVNAKQLAAATSATNASTSETNATTQAGIATTQAGIATAAVASGSGSPLWVSGTTYAVGNVVYSPSDFRSYRRITAGAGTTDPSSDVTNWLVVSNQPPRILVVRDEKTSGTNAGASIFGTQQRTLNTVVINTISGASLSSNNVTLPAGTYLVEASTPAFNANAHQASLVNVTDSITYTGTSETASSSGGCATKSFIDTYFTITSAKVFKINHFTTTVNATGLGPNTSSGLPEVYTVAKFTKIS